MKAMRKDFILTFFIMLGLTPTQAVAQKVIDVHCHNILPSYIEVLDRHGAALEETFPLPTWNVESHLAFMKDAGIECSVLTMPAPQPWFGSVDESCCIIREYNEYCAALKKAYPGKFKFCASLPLPDVKAAIREAVYALDTLGADGIKLATNSRGQYVGDVELDTLMHILNERQAVVILHPHKPSPVHDKIIATTPLAAYEYPAETTRAVINMISRNVPARYPQVKIVVPHCGSFLPLAIPRIKAIHPAMVSKGFMQEIDWEANLRNLYYDLAGAPTPDVVRTLLTITTPDHLLYGSDYPYQPDQVLKDGLKRMCTWMSKDPVLAPILSEILYENAKQLLTKKNSFGGI